MERSYNGWIASPNPERINATWFTVPGLPTRRFRCVQVSHPLFKYLIRRFNAEVDPLLGGVMDEWSYAYRKARAADALSCHASGTAVDLDATQFPMGRANMTAKQRKAVESILAASRKQFRWGGSFRMPYTDEMHFELVKGTTPATVKAAIATMGLHDDGRVVNLDDLGRDHRTRVPLLKRALADQGRFPKRFRYSPRWTPALTTAVDAWIGEGAPQERLDRLGALSHRF